MKLNFANLGLIGAAYILAIGNSQAQAEVTPDGSLSTAVSGINSYTITGGTVVGNNLFHSFQQFSIPAGGSAKFSSSSGIQNIFSRVTGGDASYINGFIETNSGVNLFLLNPAGIIFGDKASLNVGGSFIGTTANGIKFADGKEFSSNTTISPGLTISVPIGLQMGQNPAAIQVQASTTPLQVPTNKTLALVGGDILIDSRTLSTPQGRIEIGAVDDGIVSLTPNNLGWSLGYQDVQNFRDITLSKQSLLSTGGNGEINIWGANLTLSGGSRVSVQNTTNVTTPGKISVHTSELLTVTGDNTSGNTTSAIRAGAVGTGMVANIEIFTKDLIANNGGIILTNNSGTSVGGGNITVNASGTIQVAGVGKIPSNRSGISGLTFFSGKGGNVNVSTNKLVILDGAVVTTSTLFRGAAGNVTVNAAESIHLSGFETASTGFAPSSLSSSTLGAGDSGNLIVNTAKLSVHDGARVEASSYASGNAGNVILNASESVEVAGKPAQSFLIPSFIGSSTVQQAGSSRVLTGNSGDVHITTQQLRVADGGLVNVRNDGTGNAGKVGIDANFVMLDTQGAITATTQVGEGGNIIVNADTLLMRHNSAINATSGSVGSVKGGEIALNIDTLQLNNQSIISSNTTGIGNAGKIDVIAKAIALNQSSIESQSLGASGDAGGIKLQATNTVELDNSTISANTSGKGKSGEITINTGTLQLHNQSIISSNTTGIGNAGKIDVIAKAIALNQSTISSQSSGIGDSGTVKFNTGTLDLIDNAIVSTASSQSGKAGNLNITASDRINLQNGSQITSRSTGTGNGGTVDISGRTLILKQDAQISTSTVASDGGNLVLNLSDFLLMRDRSLLNAEAGGTGDGGNITINAPFIIGTGNSDIIANAVRGRGGNINITTNSIVGLDYRNQLTPDNDITASSEFGVNGTVQITTPNVNPNSGLVELPANVTDPSQQIAKGCSNDNGSSFVATGRGGIPQNPTQEIRSDRTWADTRDISAFHTKQQVQAQTPKSPEILVQATGWRRNAQGKIELVAHNSPKQIQSSLTCAGIQR